MATTLNYYNPVRASEGKAAWGRKCPACERPAYSFDGDICTDCSDDAYYGDEDYEYGE